jgi:hypothetical protein
LNSRRSPVSRGSSSPPRTSVIPISIVNQRSQKPLANQSASHQRQPSILPSSTFRVNPSTPSRARKTTAKPAPQKTSAAATQHIHNTLTPQVVPASTAEAEPQQQKRPFRRHRATRPASHPTVAKRDGWIHNVPRNVPTPDRVADPSKRIPQKRVARRLAGHSMRPLGIEPRTY